jgi:hypothetical protein
MTDHRPIRTVATATAAVLAMSTTLAAGATATPTPFVGQAYSPAAALFPEASTVAQSFWPDSPCNGREMVALVDPVIGVDASGTEVEVAGKSGIGDPDCRVILKASWTRDPVFACYLMAHEFGHLAGLPDSPDPSNVMYGQFKAAPAQCLALETPDAPPTAAAPPVAVTPTPPAHSQPKANKHKHKTKHRREFHRKKHRTRGQRAEAQR